MTRCLLERRRGCARQATTSVLRRLQAVVMSILTKEKVGAIAETEADATPPSEEATEWTPLVSARTQRPLSVESAAAAVVGGGAVQEVSGGRRRLQ